MLEIKGISVGIKDRIIVDDISFEVGNHDIYMIIGPNGAGKTTLFKAIMGLVPHKGKVLLDGTDIGTFRPGELARKIGMLSQSLQPQFAYSVYDVVSLGRYSYQRGIFRGLTDKDKEKIEEALVLTGMESIKDQSVLTLSGGELQRAFLAQLFAQDPQVLILDEPVSHLDLQYQIAVFDILSRWVREKRRAVIASVHDLNTVYSYGTRAMLLNRGRIHAKGSVEEVLDKDNLRSVYNVDVAEWMKNLLEHWK